MPKQTGIPITRTRFPELALARVHGHIWRWVAADESGAFDPYTGCVGSSYRTKGEALADLDRFAADYGCNPSGAPADTLLDTVAYASDVDARVAARKEIKRRLGIGHILTDDHDAASCAQCIGDAAVRNALPVASELAQALRDVLAQEQGQSKSCGHDFYCVCPTDAARAALASAELIGL